MRKTLTWLTVVTALLAACGGTPAATANRNASTPSTASTGATTLTCRLPVAGFVPPAPKGSPDNSADLDGQPNQKGAGGFIELPGGMYTPAADSDRSYIAG